MAQALASAANYLAQGYRHFAIVNETVGLFWSRERLGTTMRDRQGENVNHGA